MKNIFNKSVGNKYGHSNLEEIAYFTSFPHGAHPYDVWHRKDDEDSFPFVFFEEHGVLKGRGWENSRCMILDKSVIDESTLLGILLFIRDDLGIDISTWTVYNNQMKSVVVADIIRQMSKRTTKRVHRLILFLEKILVDESNFTDYVKEHHVKPEKLKTQIQKSMKEYELSYKCGLLSESEEEYVDVKEKLKSLTDKF